MVERAGSDSGDAAVDQALAELADLAGPAPALLPQVTRRSAALRRRRASAIGAGVVGAAAATVAVVLASGAVSQNAADDAVVSVPAASDTPTTTTTGTPTPTPSPIPNATLTNPVPTLAVPALPLPAGSATGQPQPGTSNTTGPVDDVPTTRQPEPAQTSTPLPHGSPAVVAVPNVVGMNPQDAERTVSEAGFSFIELDGCTTADPTARVVGQEPAAGSSLNVYYDVVLHCVV